jgi:HK97 gp10 family phage protein
VLPLRKTKSAVIIGPKLARSSGGPAEGQFSGNRVDGYYAHFVEFGSLTIPPKPYMRPAATQAGPAGLRIAVTELKKAIDKYANSIAI